MTWRVIGLLVLAGLVSFGAACGDDGGGTHATTDATTDEPGSAVAADEWVAALCRGLDDWIADLEAAAESVQDVLGLQAAGRAGDTGLDTGDTGLGTGSTGSDLEEQQELLADFLDEAIDLTDALIEDVEDAGVPDVDDGEEIAAVFLGGFEEARDTFVEARERVDALPTGDVEAFRDGVQEIGDDLDVAATEIQTTFDEASDEYDTDELDGAYEDEPACRALDER